MSTARRKKPAASDGKAAGHPSPPRKKRAKNLSLSSDAIAHGEAYSRRHGTKLSKLVGDFLRALPLGEEPARALSPAVRRLYGVAAGAQASVEEYRDYLHRKHAEG